MKILQINAVYGAGSTGKIVEDISLKLLDQGHLAYAMWGIKCRSSNDSVKLVRIGTTFDHKMHALLRRISGKKGWHSLYATKKACKQILEISPDVVHLHNIHGNYINLPYLLGFLAEYEIPTVATLHDCWEYTGGCSHYSSYNCEKWRTECKSCPAAKSADIKGAYKLQQAKKSLFSKIPVLAIVGVSKWTAEDARNSILSDAKIIKHIYNWIDTEIFFPDQDQAVKGKYGIPEGEKIVLGVAQEWGNNRIEQIVSLASALPEKVSVVLVGKVNEPPLNKNIKCIGYVNGLSDLVKLYSVSDVFVNVTENDTFGLVTAEAMACGTPVVAYKNPGSSEVVGEKCGILVENRDESALSHAVVEVLESGKSGYSEACRQWVCEKFDKNKQIQEYIDLYKTVLNLKKEIKQ